MEIFKADQRPGLAFGKGHGLPLLLKQKTDAYGDFDKN
jgi:hypothetical protein